MRTLIVLAAALTLSATAQAQFEMQDSHTTASFRGVHAIGKGIAWVSGTEGTVLRTTDDGKTWQHCTTPPEADKLDFRGIQAFDEDTAIVMSSGKGDLSRLYKTTDGCKTWKLVFTNPEAPNDGFFDALVFVDSRHGLLFGDPAHGSMRNPVEGGYYAFRIRLTADGGETWAPVTDPERNQPGKNLMPVTQEGLFAASNSSASFADGSLWIGTGGGRILHREVYTSSMPVGNRDFSFRSNYCAGRVDPTSGQCGIPWSDWVNTSTPLSDPAASSGIFSIFFRTKDIGVAVGGDYQQPNLNQRNAAFTIDGANWLAPQTAPHGYRSSVAYYASTKTWITTGPNGTDISRDDGRNWSPLKPSAQDAPDADKNWNALSLPFVVGPKGRIGRLRPDALKP